MLATMIAACTDRPAPPNEAASGEAAPAAAAPASAVSFEFPVADGAPSAFPLAPGSFIAGTLPPHAGSALKAIAIQVGNYGNTSDGVISVEVCRGDQCTSGQASMAQSVDNAYLEVALNPALAGDEAAPFRYRIVKVDGSNPVAIWLYPLPKEQQAPKANEQATLAGMPKMALRY
jgi:hypothetical protein